MARLYFPELASVGVLKTAYEPQTKLYLLDPKDVGSFAAEALTTERGKWHEQLIPLVAQELTMGEIAEGITDWLGGSGAVRPEFMVREEKEKMKMMNPMVAAQIWLSQNGFGAYSDMEKQYGIPLGSLQDFSKREAKGDERGADNLSEWRKSNNSSAIFFGQYLAVCLSLDGMVNIVKRQKFRKILDLDSSRLAHWG